MKRSIKEILYSPQFLREVSWLLFVFAALNCIFGILFVWSAPLEPEALALASGSFLLALVYVVLAIFIRRGSIKTLWIAIILFAVDTIFLLMQPSGGLGIGIVARILLLGVLISYIRRERRRA